MIPFFVEYLTSLGIKVPSLFFYASSRMIFASLTTLVLTILFGKLFIGMLCALKVGHTIRVSDVAVLRQQYQKSSEIPSMGGVLFITQITIAALLWMDFSYAFTFILLFAMLWMGGIGALDDYMKLKGKNSKGIRPRMKLILQLLFALSLTGYLWTASPEDKTSLIKPPSSKEKGEQGVMHPLSAKEYSSRYYIPFCKTPLILGGVVGGAVGVVLAFLLTNLVISGSANAVNLADGLDGLATGLSLFVGFVLAIVAFLSNHSAIAQYLNILYIEGSGEIGVFLSATLGALLGFLWFNWYPAEVFMGDTGSLAIGGILGVSAVLLRREFLLALVGGVFVAETLSVILQVWSVRYRGKRIFKCAPLHHHFQIEGWHETKIVIRFWMIGLILSLIGLASIKVQ